MLYGVDENGSIFEVNVNYEAVWDSLRLKDWQRRSAKNIVESFDSNADPTSRNELYKTRKELEKAGEVTIINGELKEYAGRLNLAEKIDNVKTNLVNKLIEVGILQRHPILPKYALNPKRLSRLERKF